MINHSFGIITNAPNVIQNGVLALLIQICAPDANQNIVCTKLQVAICPVKNLLQQLRQLYSINPDCLMHANIITNLLMLLFQVPQH